MFIAETQIRVRYADTDQMKVVYHGNYAQYFESARSESIRKLGFTYKDMEAMGIIMPVTELHTKFIRPAYYDELLTIKTTLRELSLHPRIEFHHEIFDEKGGLLTVGRVVLYFLDAHTMKKTSMPQPLYARLEVFFRPDDPLVQAGVSA